MIGLDTNILVRLATGDDAAQSNKVRHLFSSLSAANQAYVSLVALAESFWVLKVVYKKPADSILEFFDFLLEAEEVAFQSPEVVHSAIMACKDGADFSDALIACSNRLGGCSKTVTFDKRARASAGMELL